MTDTAAPLRRIAVILENGFVQNICSETPEALADVEIMVINYDTEDADLEDLSLVPQEDGTDAEAVVSFQSIDRAAISLSDIRPVPPPRRPGAVVCNHCQLTFVPDRDGGLCPACRVALWEYLKAQETAPKPAEPGRLYGLIICAHVGAIIPRKIEKLADPKPLYTREEAAAAMAKAAKHPSVESVEIQQRVFPQVAP